MEARGNLVRIAVVALVVCLAAGVTALSARAQQRPASAAAKKCKKKHHARKRRCRRPAPASISVSPTSADFGMPSVGDEPIRTFTVTNMGGSLSGVPVPVIGGPGGASFSVVANGCTTPLAPGAVCPISVQLPFKDPVGPKSATLDVTAVPGGTASAAMTGDVEI
ncbi:MAG: hypothetical protein WB462_16790 [Solirubrobacterales bacterium]